MSKSRGKSPYARIEALISQEQCVILDGGTATELEVTLREDRERPSPFFS
ncbi:MAG TPA: hypothetical protein VFA00_10340 [Actinomycetota bacterium]|jgi:hypothetical protein|nr:hypothetical protein [Actinomycetota bacterium]